MRECLLLVKNNVPFDTAFRLDSAMRQGWCIIFQEFESGLQFDFNTRRFPEAS